MARTVLRFPRDGVKDAAGPPKLSTGFSRKIANMIELSIHDKVEKIGGDYTFVGHIVAVFQKLSGQVRYVVEDDRGVLHIYSYKNLKLSNTPGYLNRQSIGFVNRRFGVQVPALASPAGAQRTT